MDFIMAILIMDLPNEVKTYKSIISDSKTSRKKLIPIIRWVTSAWFIWQFLLTIPKL